MATTRKTKNRIYCIDLEIVRRRESLGLSQEDLSVLAGIPKMTLCDIENCISVNPSIDTMYKLSKALNCSIEDILGL